MKIYTVGHSNRPLADFLAILAAHGVQRVLDVRSRPGSRYNPHFDQERLSVSLQDAGIGYTHLLNLGGLRKGSGPSTNLAWRNLSFRNYADYMQTDGFGIGLHAAQRIAVEETCTLMCSEAVPWRCHRSLIADALLVRGWEVVDIFDAKHVQQHKLTKFARVDGLRVTYPLVEEEFRLVA